MPTREDLESSLLSARDDLRIAERELARFEPDETEAHDRFDEHMREIYGDVEVCGVLMDSLDILKNHDEAAYHEAFNNWLDGEDMSTFSGYDGLEQAVSDAKDEVIRIEGEIEELDE